MAITSLLVGHFFPNSLVNFGAVGVELFFVLSGRLMAEILFVRKTSVPTFIRRRISRVVPALLFFGTAVLAASFVMPWLIRAEVPDYLAGMFFFANYWDYVSSMAGPYMHLWSLAVEEHTYLILAAIALVLSSRSKLAAPFAFALAFAAMIWGAYQAIGWKAGGHDLYWRTDVRAASILLPFALYLTMRGRLSLVPSWVADIAFVSALAAGLALSTNLVPEWLRYTAGTLCFSAAIVLLGATSGALKAVLSTRVLAFVGTLSFSIYLWQQPFYEANSHLQLPWLLLPAALLLALISFYVVERPVRRYLNRTWASERGASGVIEVPATSPVT